MPAPRASRRGLAGLRRRVRRELRSLDLPTPLSLEVLCERLGERRGRPLSMRFVGLPVPGPFGYWMATEESDTILVQSATTASHQFLIALHELGHVMAGHSSRRTDSGEPPPGSPSDETLQELLPDVPSWMIQGALHREIYDNDQEREAELVGSLIMEWADRIASTAAPSADTSTARRMQDALAERQGWL